MKQGESKKGGVAVILSPKAQSLYVDGSYRSYFGDTYRGRLISITLAATPIFVMYAPKIAKVRATFSVRLMKFLEVITTGALIIIGKFNED